MTQPVQLVTINGAEIRPEGGNSRSIYLDSLSIDSAHGRLLAAMLPTLALAPETTHSMLDLVGCSNWHSPLLDQLVKMGKITLEDVREALRLEHEQ